MMLHEILQARPWLRARFLAKVDQSGECHTWTAALRGAGYGVFSLGGPDELEYAHRVAWALAHGRIPDGVCVCHACDNPACVRVSHLWLGTQGANMADKATKRRGRKPAPSPERLYLGVFQHNHVYHAQIIVDGQRRPLGRFKSAVAAARAYDAAARYIEGDSAVLNGV